MPVKQSIPNNSGIFFITFTCFEWEPLIEITNSYDLIYSWFNVLKSKGHYINGYVVMPNHIHAILSFKDTGQSINTIIGNGKRFIAYKIIERLKEQDNKNLLHKLQQGVEPGRRSTNHLHAVWEKSFDWKHCTTWSFINQKLIYIHHNPCAKKWNLCDLPQEYAHSSAAYYIEGIERNYPVTNYMEMDDINLNSGE